jgi:choline-sulfatase
MQGFMRRVGSDMTVGASHLKERRSEEYARCERAFADYKWSEAKEVRRAGIGRGPCVAHDEYALQGALNYIEEYFLSPYYDREMHAPLLLKVSFAQPHYQFLTSEGKFNYYLNRVDPYLNQPMPEHPYLRFRTAQEDVDVTTREIRRATAAYYGMVETVDEYFGKVLEALRHAGQDLEDWIIIYTTDHGEMLGQHSQWEKIKFHDGSARVPLIIRWPKHFQPRVVQENVNLCDLFATLCELCGIEAPTDMDSRNLVPLMCGESANWNNETISQYGQKCLMLKRDNLKYQYLYYYNTEYPELLYDLENDPEETKNLIDNPAYAKQLAAFRDRLSELGHGPHPCLSYSGTGYSA